MTSERIEDGLDAFVRSKQKGTDSGNYQRNARRAIEEWIDRLANRDEPIESFDQPQVSYMRQYARYLKRVLDIISAVAESPTPATMPLHPSTPHISKTFGSGSKPPFL
jgi:hypothetical protein